MEATAPAGGGRRADGAEGLAAPLRAPVLALGRWAAGLPPTAGDALLAAVLFGVVLGPGRMEGPRGLLIQAALLLPLVWRRRAPFTVFCAVAAVAFGQWLLGVQLPADVALLVALYTVVAYGDRRRVAAAAAVTAAAVLLAAARWAPEGRFVTSAAAMGAFALAAAAFGSTLRARRAYVAQLRERALNLERANLQEARLAAAEERSRITREMHDIVTHNLSVIVALADAAVYARRGSPGDAVMERISETGRQALTDMRRTLGVLRPDEPDAHRHPAPGVAQLEPLAQHMRAAGLPTRLLLEGDPADLPAAAQLTVYRLVQEALTNTLKHAPHATGARVRVTRTPYAVTVDVTDDGPAAVPAPAAPPSPTRQSGPSGHGIAGMRARAAAYGGVLEAGPAPGGGWRVSTRLDVRAVEDGAV
ncbi:MULTISPECIES: sensor histidine kinase [unclassified Streptomyces]|uniref:sensor histidine kinase n=1 Tax=unclassified Streptomyces TaxID=2593676 RepID=UPI0038208045